MSKEMKNISGFSNKKIVTGANDKHNNKSYKTVATKHLNF